MARSVNVRKWREWRQRIKRFEKRRQSVAEFCRGEGVSEAALYQWRKRLAGTSTSENDTTVATPDGFTTVRLTAATSVAVQLPGGTQVQVPASDRQALRLVIDRLARADARRAGVAPC